MQDLLLSSCSDVQSWPLLCFRSLSVPAVTARRWAPEGSCTALSLGDILWWFVLTPPRLRGRSTSTRGTGSKVRLHPSLSFDSSSSWSLKLLYNWSHFVLKKQCVGFSATPSPHTTVAMKQCLLCLCVLCRFNKHRILIFIHWLYFISASRSSR